MAMSRLSIRSLTRLDDLGSTALRVGGPLADAEDDELGRVGGRYPDEADETPVVEIVLGHGGAVTAHEVRLFGAGSHECAGAPDHQQEVLDALPDRRPQPL